MFAATGVTDGFSLQGVRFTASGAETSSIVMRSRSGTVRFLETRHRFEGHPVYGEGRPGPERPGTAALRPGRRPDGNAGPEPEFSLGSAPVVKNGRVAHLDRVPASEAGGSGFESRRAHLKSLAFLPSVD